jgi:hypothetical protein
MSEPPIPDELDTAKPNDLAVQVDGRKEEESKQSSD